MNESVKFLQFGGFWTEQVGKMSENVHLKHTGQAQASTIS